MQKVKSNALWNELSPENLEKLDTWLFEDHLSYADILPKAQQELGFKGSIGSLKRYGKRREQELLVTDLEEAGKDAAKVCNSGASPDTLRVANMRIVGVYLFQALRKNPDAIKELAPVIKTVLQNDYNETIREIKNRELQLREQALAFTKDKFQRDIIEQAVQALPDIQELVRLRQEPDATPEERKGYIDVVRQRLFGLGDQPQPESPGKEAEVLSVQKAPEAGEAPAAEELQPEPEPITLPESPASNQDDGEYTAMKVKQETQQREREVEPRESRAQAEAAKSEEEKLREQQAAERAEQKKQREERERAKQKRFEEIREICGWQEVDKPPGWGDME